MDYRDKFLGIYNSNIKREGADRLLTWLEESDFFTAPASTKYHCAKEGGLVEHSVKVYEVLMKKHFELDESEESFAICALLHDVCKVNFYKRSFRNIKNELGRWEQVEYYSVEDSFPYGHGEKSVFLIERFMKLRLNEAMAIRWHMSGFDDSIKGGSYAIGLAYDKYPLAVKLGISDLESTYLHERGTSQIRA